MSSVNFLHLNREIITRIMESLSIAERAQVGRTCRQAKDAWDNYPWSVEDYGSTILHRLPPPDLRGRPALHIRDLIVERLSYRRAYHLEFGNGGLVADWTDMFTDETCAREVTMEPPESTQAATRTLMRYANYGNYPEKHWMSWEGYDEALKFLGREEERITIVKKRADSHRLLDALEEGDLSSAQILLDAGVPVVERRLSTKAMARDQTRKWVVRALVQQNDHDGLDRMFMRLCNRCYVPLKGFLETIDDSPKISDYHFKNLSALIEDENACFHHPTIYNPSSTWPEESEQQTIEKYILRLMNHPAWSHQHSDLLMRVLTARDGPYPYPKDSFSPLGCSIAQRLLADDSVSIDSVKRCVKVAMMAITNDDKECVYSARDKERVKSLISGRASNRLY